MVVMVCVCVRESVCKFVCVGVCVCVWKRLPVNELSTKQLFYLELRVR